MAAHFVDCVVTAGDNDIVLLNRVDDKDLERAVLTSQIRASIAATSGSNTVIANAIQCSFPSKLLDGM